MATEDEEEKVRVVGGTSLTESCLAKVLRRQIRNLIASSSPPAPLHSSSLQTTPSSMPLPRSTPPSLLQTANSLTTHNTDSSVEILNLIKSVDHQHTRRPSSSRYWSSTEESEYGRGTTAEQLEVLNMIRRVEDRCSCCISLIKALKEELNHAQSHVGEMMQMHSANYHEMHDLRRQIMKAELNGETEEKLSWRSKNSHPKIIKELSEVKSAYSKAMNDFDEQSRINIMLLELCDEFASGVGEYEEEIRDLRHKFDEIIGGRIDPPVLSISETWLAKRLQMKISEDQRDLSGKIDAMGRLSDEIIIFLQTRRSAKSINTNAHHNSNTVAADKYNICQLFLSKSHFAILDNEINNLSDQQKYHVIVSSELDAAKQLSTPSSEKISLKEKLEEARIDVKSAH